MATEKGNDGKDLALGEMIIEGKTKQVYNLPSSPNEVLLLSKDQITAHNAVMKDQMQGKAVLATATTCNIFKLLNNAGIKTAFVRRHSDRSFISRKCEMVPIEWVTRRVATGSFLKRNAGVPEGYKFSPPKMETFFKDDAAGDPQWSEEQVICTGLKAGDKRIGRDEYELMGRTTVAIFEVLERAWAVLDCTLVDMKVEYGVDSETGDLLLADVIDNDSWRLWPQGDRTQMKDKQVYRDLKNVTAEAMKKVKAGYEWVADKTELLHTSPQGQVVVVMGSASDTPHCRKIKATCGELGIRCSLRVASAHKGTDDAITILREAEGSLEPVVLVAVAGRSNGLGPVLSGQGTCPVINCPPIKPDWGSQDIWSSLRMPSGLGCVTVLAPEAAALAAAQILATTQPGVWGKLRARRLNTELGLRVSDAEVVTQTLAENGTH